MLRRPNIGKLVCWYGDWTIRSYFERGSKVSSNHVFCSGNGGRQTCVFTRQATKFSDRSCLPLFFFWWGQSIHKFFSYYVDGKDTVRSQQVVQQAPMPTQDSRTGFRVDGTLITTPKAPFCLKTPLALHIQVNTRKTCIYQRNEVVFIKMNVKWL